MKIKFYTEGGKNIGFGHINRCLSLAQAFDELNYKCEFTIMGDASIQNLITYFKVKIFDWISNQEHLFEELSKNDVVVIDSYKAPAILINEFSKLNKNLLFFDDYNRINYPAGYIINGALNAEQIYEVKSENIIYYLGPDYQTLRSEFWNVGINKKQSSIKNILITFGGDDSRNLTPMVINLLNEYNPDLIKTVIVGNSFTSIEQIDLLKSEKTEIVFNPTANKICELMSNSDLAICGAGQTLYELARVKTPVLFIGIAENQENNIKSWIDYPYFNFVGWWNSDDIIGRLRESFIQFDNNFKNIAGSIYSSKLIIDGQGSKRIVEKVMSYVRKN